jgi:hypothetical protein
VQNNLRGGAHLPSKSGHGFKVNFWTLGSKFSS